MLFSDKEKQKIDLGLLVGGEAGMGISTTGETISKILLRYGYWSFQYNENPSIIKGGHYASYIHATKEESYSHSKNLDLVIALNFETITKHLDELTDKARIIFDKSISKSQDPLLNDPRIIDVPLNALAKQYAGNELMRNTVAAGALLPLFGIEISLLEELINEEFGKKGEEVVKQNINCARAGYNYVAELINNEKVNQIIDLQKLDQEGRMLITGNDAISLGALKAGLKFYAAYPMTPASSVLHTLAKYEQKYQIVTKHAEDEIAAINMAIGASFAGVRSMVATSGGGFSLMVEGLGLAAITETPIVIVIAQRPGPATGLPTWTDQSDLHFALNASQGEFPRVVLAPGDPEECFSETHRSFNIADRFQLPVIILSDKYLSESPITAKRFKTDGMIIDRGSILPQAAVKRLDKYSRYENTISGVSPRTLPGTEGGEFLANSDEHDEYGFANEESENRIEQMDKRFRKMFDVSKYIPAPQVYGSNKAKISILCWGSVKLQMLDVQSALHDMGIEIKFMHLIYLSPFPINEVKDFIENAQEIIIVENNATAQLAHLIREKTSLTVDRLILKYDGRPFERDELIKEILNNKNL